MQKDDPDGGEEFDSMENGNRIMGGFFYIENFVQIFFDGECQENLFVK